MTSPNVAAARDALVLAQERYPAPLAHVAGELLYELSAARPNYMRCFLLEIDLFEVSVAFFAFVQLAELARRGAPAQAAEAAVRQLHDNPALCTGHWWALLRETARDVQAAREPKPTAVAGDLAGIYYDPSGRAARLGQVLDQVPGLRNRVKGHSWTLPDEQYRKHALDLLDTVAGYLGCLEVLANHLLFLCAGSSTDGDGSWADLVELQGDSRRPRRRQIRSEGALQTGAVYVGRRDEVLAGRLDADTVLCLHPFVQVRGRDGRSEELYLLQSLQGKHAELRSVVGSDTVACAPSLTEARALLARLLSRQGNDPLDPLRRAMAEANREVLDSPAGRASYHPDTYFVRRRVLRDVEDFIASGAPAALLSAPSGMGKTALACHLADRWLVSADKARCVLLAPAHEVAAADGSLARWCQRRLGRPLAEVRDAAAAADAHVLIVVDGVDRLPDPAAVLDEALSPGQDSEPGPLHFLFTTTEAGLSLSARVGGATGHAGLRRLVIPPLDRAEARKVYDLFRAQGGTDGAEPAEDLLGALTTPLLLRLAHAAGAGDPRDRGAGQVLLAYTERVVFSDLSRAAVVNRLVEEMLATGERTVPVAALTRDPTLAPAVLADGPEAPLRGLIREGILVLERLPAGDRLPLPSETHIGFTFDQLRDFFLFTRLARRFEDDPAWLLERAREATATSPLVGGLRFLFLERLRGPDWEEALGRLVEFLGRLPDVPRRALLRQLLALPVGGGRPLAALLRAAFGHLGAEDRSAFLEAAGAAFDDLERKGQVADAGALCELVKELGLASHPRVVLPILFDWSWLQRRAVSAVAAEATAAAACAAARALSERSLRVEALTCLDAALDAQADPERLRPVRAALGAEELEGLSPRAEFAVRMWEWDAFHYDRPPRAAAALARAKALAAAHRRPHWLARTLVAEVRRRIGGQRDTASEEAAALIGEALHAAQQAGYPGLEADVRRWAAAHAKRDQAREMEAGLEAADVSGNLAARAGILRARAHWHINRGRFDDGASDGASAAELLQRLQYRYRYLKILQHVTAICEWELGRPGRALAIWRELLDGLQQIGRTREAALSALLVAEMACDTGQADEAAALLDRARRLAAHAGSEQALNSDLAEGLLLDLQGRPDEAVAVLERARAWGREVRYTDFVFQPGIWAVRLLLGRAAGDAGLLERAHRILHEMLEDQSVDAAARSRYEGELCALYALYHAEGGAAEEARVWLEKANRWFADRPAHRAAIECRAINLLPNWVIAQALDRKAEDLEKQAGTEKEVRRLRQQAAGLRKGAGEAARPQVLEPLRKMAESFADAQERAGFIRHHPARRHLVRHGIIADE